MCEAERTGHSDPFTVFNGANRPKFNTMTRNRHTDTVDTTVGKVYCQTLIKI